MVSRCANLALAAVVFVGISGSIAGAATCMGTITTLPATCTGTLANQGTAQLLNFMLSSPSDLTITTSYGGGNNLDGSTTPAGGFQPNLVLYDSTGMFVANTTGYPPPNANTDPTTNWDGDAYLTNPNTPAGSYTVAVTDWKLGQSTTATNLSDGFTDNLGNGSTFIDVGGNTRTGNYAVDIMATPVTSAVPEPATAFLMLAAFALALLLRKRIVGLVR